MKNFLRILLATIIMPAYVIADEADEPTSPPKAEEVEVKEDDDNEEVVEDGSEEIGDTPKILKTIPLETFVSSDEKFQFHTYLVVIGNEFIPKLNEEHDGYSWVTFGKWPKPLHMGLRNTLQNKTNQTKLKTVFDLIGYLENEEN